MSDSPLAAANRRVCAAEKAYFEDPDEETLAELDAAYEEARKLARTESVPSGAPTISPAQQLLIERSRQA